MKEEMMMMAMSSSSSSSSSARNPPFTPSQWQELEHQALVYKYIISGIPIPPDLLFSIRRSCLLLDAVAEPFHHFVGFHVGRKVDPEPGRCRRTDGKKWRCSKEAFPESKYCERHMHRGRNRSRKPVETLSNNTAAAATTTTTTNNNFLYQHFPFSKPPETPTKSHSGYDFRYRSDEGSLIFSESSSNSGTLRSMEGKDSEFSWKLAPVEMHMQMGKQNSDHYSSDLQSQTGIKIRKDYYVSGHRFYASTEEEEEEEQQQQPNKVMHHFFDEWSSPKHTEDNNNKSSSATATTQLSISMPNSMHDFFVTQKW